MAQGRKDDSGKSADVGVSGGGVSGGGETGAGEAGAGEAGGGESYRAFISYSHVDRRFAFWLHRRLEGYVLPRALRGSAPAPRKVFIDRAELAAGTDLSAAVAQALTRSAALIVIASPAARQSLWVAREIAVFRTMHPDRPVLVALRRGAPGEAIPAAVQHGQSAPVEPLAADFRKVGDGRRLALLKLVAGLWGVPLDALLQRDSQRRLRRVTAITAVLALVGLWTSLLALAAWRSRNEAEAQRNESEAMVEFMLTDLRQRLKAVGRLDVMDSVNARVLRHYDAMHDLARLPADVLERRARLLTAMGEDALKRGDYRTGTSLFGQSWRVTGTLAERQPDNAAVLFAHAQNAYWLGEVRFLQRDAKAARPFWQAYRDLADRLARSEPGALRGRTEQAYAQANLCALGLDEKAPAAMTLPQCTAAVQAAQDIALRRPDDLQAQLDLATNIAWQAEATGAAGDRAHALALRQRQSALVESLPARFARDARVAQARMVALLGLARAAVAAGQRDVATGAVGRARLLASELEALDPHNRQWAQWRDQIADTLHQSALHGSAPH